MEIMRKIEELKVVQNKFNEIEKLNEKYKQENDSLKKEIELSKMNINTNENAKPKQLIMEIVKSDTFDILGVEGNNQGEGEEEEYEELYFKNGNIPPQFLQNMQNQHVGEDGDYGDGDEEEMQELDEEQMQKLLQMQQMQQMQMMQNQQNLNGPMNNNQIEGYENEEMEDDGEEYYVNNEEGNNGEIEENENEEGMENLEEFINDPENAKYMGYEENENEGEEQDDNNVEQIPIEGENSEGNEGDNDNDIPPQQGV